MASFHYQLPRVFTDSRPYPNSPLRSDEELITSLVSKIGKIALGIITAVPLAILVGILAQKAVVVSIFLSAAIVVAGTVALLAIAYFTLSDSDENFPLYYQSLSHANEESKKNFTQALRQANESYEMALEAKEKVAHAPEIERLCIHLIVLRTSFHLDEVRQVVHTLSQPNAYGWTELGVQGEIEKAVLASKKCKQFAIFSEKLLMLVHQLQAATIAFKSVEVQLVPNPPNYVTPSTSLGVSWEAEQTDVETLPNQYPRNDRDPPIIPTLLRARASFARMTEQLTQFAYTCEMLPVFPFDEGFAKLEDGRKRLQHQVDDLLSCCRLAARDSSFPQL